MLAEIIARLFVELQWFDISVQGNRILRLKAYNTNSF